MSDLQHLQQEARSAREAIRDAEEKGDSVAVETAKKNLKSLLSASALLQQPQETVEQLSDHLPFLLFPVRIEARFMQGDTGKELWVRIFPDDIAAHTHEEKLTADEVEAGKTYWEETEKAGQEEDKKKGAWRVLAEAYGGPRAAWIREKTRIGTNPGPPKQESWSRSPRTYIMSDRFIVIGYSASRIFTVMGEQILANPLMLGPDPSKEDFKQPKDGNLIAGEDIAWIYNFDKALKAGMASKIKLDEDTARHGFDRLLVLGLRLSSSAEDSRRLLRDLFDNHHYSPDGMSFVPQGTPTNNTEGKGSGFSSTDDTDTSYTVEHSDLLSQDTSSPFQKKDGQRLADALAIDKENEEKVFRHIRFADRYDIEEAMAMNKALWPLTLGFFFEDLLGLESSLIGRIREFFTNYVTGRGPLPAIRVGVQPYGILVTSDFARWKWTQQEAGEDFQFLTGLHKRLSLAQNTWQKFVKDGHVPHIGAIPQSDGENGPRQNLMSIIGLQPASVEFHRRHAVGKKFLWNYANFATPGVGLRLITNWDQFTQTLLRQLDLKFSETPRIFDLAAFQGQDTITDPLVDDVPPEKPEKLSEDKPLKNNYIRWLYESSFNDLRDEKFGDGKVPRPLLYRMLRGALLQAYYDATRKLYQKRPDLPQPARREVELINIVQERTITRWEYMEADISKLLPDLNLPSRSVAAYLQECLRSENAANCPAEIQAVLTDLREVWKCLEVLKDLPTARLERLFVEHLDLCSYRLDAWQTACFHQRLQPPPVISYFRPIFTEIKSGQSVNLEWDVSNAEDLTLGSKPFEKSSLPCSAPGPCNVTGRSGFPVQPTAPVGKTIDFFYTLTAKNSFGKRTATVLVRVTGVIE